MILYLFISVLPGKKDEIDLEWVPKGHNETIDKYLKTLPPEKLPVKGSQAAQDRKQLLQKQIPIHDIDPTLCHDLTEDELNKMNEYISYVKQASAGIGQIVSLSSIIKGKLHMLNPAEAAIIASRYAKGVPMSEIVKLQGHNKTSTLGQSLDKLSLKNKSLPQFNPNVQNQSEDITNPLVSTKMHDMEYSLYSSNDTIRPTPNAQFSSGIGPRQFKNLTSQVPIDPTIDQKYLQNPNFDPKNRPSNFMTSNTAHNMGSLNKNPLEFNSETSAFVPYQKVSGLKSGDVYSEDNSSMNPNYAKNLPGQNRNNYHGVENTEQIYENVRDFKKSPPNLPNYAPAKFNTYADVQSPTRIPKNVKDLAFSTYEPGEMDSNEIREQQNGFKLGKYRQPGGYADDIPKNSNGFRPIEVGNYSNPPAHHFEPINPTGQRGVGSVGSQTGTDAQFKSLHTNIYNSSSCPVDSMPEEFRSGHPNQIQETSTIGARSGYNSQTNTDPRTQKYGHQENLGNEMYTTEPGNRYDHNIEDPSYHGQQMGVQSGNLSGQAPHDSQMYTTDPGNRYGYNIEDPSYPGHQIGVHTGNVSGQTPNASQMYTTDPGNRYGYNIDEPSYQGVKPGNTGHNPNDANQMYITDPSNTKYGYNINNVTKEPSYSENLTGVRSGGPSGHLYNQTDPKYGHMKNMSEHHPSDLRISEDFLNPSHVNIGLIKDINYSDIKTATHETGDFYEEYSPDSIKEILNNVILPDCHYCKKPFEENEFAVTIDRANVLFHAGCFKCAGCNQILADNVYFYNKDTDNIYCLRDYAKIRGFPRCKACDELIFTKEYCLAENSTFHLKHFCCTECDMPLAGQDYLLEDEMPYCLPCFEQNKASKCNSCGKTIKPDEVGCTLKDIHFHAVDACFACKICKAPLMGKKFLMRNDQLYCSHECFGRDQ